MADDWGIAAIPPLRGDDHTTDDWRYVPPALRPVRARGLLAALVMLFAAGVVALLALPSYSIPPL
jgi:hypothetical protein